LRTEPVRIFVGLPCLLAMAALCVTSVAALASTSAPKYVEVWNPPESQLSKGKIRTHAAIPLQGKKKHKNPAMKRVVDKTMLAPPALSAPAVHLKTEEKPSKQTPLLPPLIGPDGRVLRVGYSPANK